MAVHALVAWTVLVWTTRIRNILSDDGGLTDLLLPRALTALAVLALVDRRRGVPALAGATVAVWAVRVPMILVHDHSAAFVAVHLVLAAVSVALAVWAVRQGRRAPRRATASGTAPRRLPS